MAPEYAPSRRLHPAHIGTAILIPAALIGLGVVLFAMTVVVNLAARVVVRRAEVRMRGAAAG